MPADFVQIYRGFAYNNAWANHRLLSACAKLGPTEFERDRTGFFPSLQKTLNHIYVVDLFYIDALEGGSLGPDAFGNPVPYPSAGALQAAQAAVDRRLIAFCNALTAERLDDIVRVHRETRIQDERCDRLLMHLFQHDIHHRGQAHAMLSGTAAAPPQLDEFFAIDEARSGPAISPSWAGPRKPYGEGRMDKARGPAAAAANGYFRPDNFTGICGSQTGRFRNDALRGTLRSAPHDDGPFWKIIWLI